MTDFEPWSSGFENNLSANWPTTTAQSSTNLRKKVRALSKRNSVLMLGIVVHHVLHENFGRFVKNVILANSLKTLSPDPFRETAGVL